VRKAEIEMSLVQAVDRVICKVMYCNSSRQCLDRFFRSLRNCELWPMPEELQKNSIRMVFEKIVTNTLPANSFSPCGSETCTCDPGKFHLALLMSKELASGTEGGLCLDCVKRGAKPGKEAKCRFCIS